MHMRKFKLWLPIISTEYKAQHTTDKTFSIPSHTLNPVHSYTILTELSWFLRWDDDIKMDLREMGWVWIGFMWLRVGATGCEHDNKSGFCKIWISCSQEVCSVTLLGCIRCSVTVYVNIYEHIGWPWNIAKLQVIIRDLISSEKYISVGHNLNCLCSHV